MSSVDTKQLVRDVAALLEDYVADMPSFSDL